MPRKTKVGYFVFSDDKKVPGDDKRLLDKFASDQMHGGIHATHQAALSFKKGFQWLEQLRLAELDMHKKGLVATAERAEELQALQRSLVPVIEKVMGQYKNRVSELVEAERALEVESARQRNDTITTRAKTLRAKKAAERHYEPQEEPAIPNVIITPEDLIANQKAFKLGANNEKKIRGAQ